MLNLRAIFTIRKTVAVKSPHLICNDGAFQHRGDLSNGIRVVKARDVVPRDDTVRAGKVVFQSTLDVLGKTVETLLVVQFGQLGSISDVSRYAIRGEIAKRSTTTAFSSVEFTVRERKGRGEGEKAIKMACTRQNQHSATLTPHERWLLNGRSCTPH